MVKVNSVLIATIGLGLILACSAARAQKPINYSQHVQPILRAKCLNCHNTDDREADLDLSTLKNLLKGGSGGPVVKTGSPLSSRLYQSITHADGVEAMPPNSPPLKKEQIDLVADWIRGGLLAGPNSKPKSTGLGMTIKEKKIQSPLPDLQLYPAAKIKTFKRTPIPQAIAASPGAPLFAVSGQQQILLYGLKKKDGTLSGKPLQSKKATEANNDSGSNVELLTVLEFPEGIIHNLKFSKDGTLLLAAGGLGAQSGIVVLFDVKSGKRLATIGDEVDSVLAADLSFDHKWLVLGNSQKVIKIYDATTGQLVHRIKKHSDWITSIAFSHSSDYVATADRSGGVFIWEAKKGAIVLGLKEHATQVNDLAWRADDQILATGAEDGQLILWSLKDGFPVLNKAAHVTRGHATHTRKTGILSIDFLDDGKILTAGRDRRIKIWNNDGSTNWQHEAKDIPVQARHSKTGQMVGLYSGELMLIDSRNRIVKKFNAQK